MKNLIKHISAIFVVFAVSSSLFTPLVVHAQDAPSSETTNDQPLQPKSALEVKPILNEIAVKPGETVEKEMIVTSLANIPLPIKAYTRSFIATNDTGGSDYPDIKDPGVVQNWFILENPDFILQPKATNIVKLKIKVPADARPGGHYATLFFESLIPKEALSETSFYLSSRIGALFFFVVAGDITEKGSITEFKTERVWRHEDINFDIAFTNQGNVHIRPRSLLTITDWRGNVVEKIEDRGNTTLPEKSRKWNLIWTKRPWIGKFKAKLETRIDQDSPIQTREATFFVFPSTEFGLLLIILLIGLFILRGRKRIVKAAKAVAGNGK